MVCGCSNPKPWFCATMYLKYIIPYTYNRQMPVNNFTKMNKSHPKVKMRLEPVTQLPMQAY
ncbi:unnamed protein product [Schistosoma curassoni]|uniref:Ovule protein n=1 Tax=Schistosoma curassoni TaxID=6186 RepID=A0A183JKX0_9TREM|nr:unnamed protein product [Schistosoma curassoni]